MDEYVTATFAGISLELETGGDALRGNNSLNRLREVHEPFLVTQSLPAQGRAVDIGAGFGAFALPFARRYPKWEIWCFEPDQPAFAALERNIRTHKLANVRAFPLAVMGGADLSARPDMIRALLKGDGPALIRSCSPQSSRRHHLQWRKPDADHQADKGRPPTLPAAALQALRPDLVKLAAPRAERGILEALDGAMPRWLVGESWTVLSPRLIRHGTAAAWVPFVQSPRLALRRSGQRQSWRDGLDIVLHAGDAPAEGTATAVTHLMNANDPDIRLLLVAHPQTSLPSLPDHPRLSVLQAPHPGRTTALNLGRTQSTAGHIAFLDVLDHPQQDLFTRLLDLARLSGAELVQGSGRGGPNRTSLPKEVSFRLDGQDGGFLPAYRLMADFPPSSARIYRRDFLDTRRIWLPEHLGAFSGHYLHFMALQHAGEVPILPGARLGETRTFDNSDERVFYLLEVCRLILKRGIQEGWRNFFPVIDGICLALRDTCQNIAPPLQGDFLDGMAELLVLMEKALGSFMPRPADQVIPEIPRLADAIQSLRHRLKDQDNSYAWAWLDSPRMQAPFMAKQAQWQRKGPE